MGPNQFWFSTDPEVFTPGMSIEFRKLLSKLKKKIFCFCIISLSLHGILATLVTIGLILALFFYIPENILITAKTISSVVFAFRLAALSFEGRSHYQLLREKEPKSARVNQILSVSVNTLCHLVETFLLVWLCSSRFQMDLTWLGIVLVGYLIVLFLSLAGNLVVIQATYELESWFKTDKSMPLQ